MVSRGKSQRFFFKPNSANHVGKRYTDGGKIMRSDLHLFARGRSRGAKRSASWFTVTNDVASPEAISMEHNKAETGALRKVIVGHLVFELRGHI